jgi:hypothetical protein
MLGKLTCKLDETHKVFISPEGFARPKASSSAGLLEFHWQRQVVAPAMMEAANRILTSASQTKHLTM